MEALLTLVPTTRLGLLTITSLMVSRPQLSMAAASLAGAVHATSTSSPLRHMLHFSEANIHYTRLTFTSGPASGKVMVVQSTNTGYDLSNNHFDILMPGGGVGAFDGCSRQYGSIPGERYGGVTSRDQCDQMPSALKQGCYWRFDWFKGSDNPDFNFEQVRCPSELTSITGCTRSDDGQFPSA